MAGTNHNPSGFSYAQAARGYSSAAASQTPSSKVTSGTASPSTGVFSDATTPRSSWADDLELHDGLKATESQRSQPDELRSSVGTQRSTSTAKSEEKTVNGLSGVSSPDLTPSLSTTTKEYELLSPPDGSSSESTWEVVSQASEPTWIADRKERQSTAPTSEQQGSSEKRDSDPDIETVSKSVLLQEAPLPTVNPWTKRAEDAKAKAVVTPKPSINTSAANTSAHKENQRPHTEPKNKPSSVTSAPSKPLVNGTDDVQKQVGNQNKWTTELRKPPSRPVLEQPSEQNRTDNGFSNAYKASPSQRHSLPKLSSVPPLVSDQSLWPTPDTVPEKERKEVVGKEAEEKREDDATPLTKRKKQEWKVLPVTPTIKFETQIMNESKSKSRGTPGRERGGRGSNGTRARGGYRGTSNGAGGPDRQSSRTESSPSNRDLDSSNDRLARPMSSSYDSISKTKRASSASSWREAGADTSPWRNSALPNGTDVTTSPGSAADLTKVTSASTILSPTEPGFRSTRSPDKSSSTEGENGANESLPKPIPRRSSSGAQTQRPSDGEGSNEQDSSESRTTPNDSRKDSRTVESSRESNILGARGGRRGGRGRGGAGVRDSPNGHVGNHTYGNYGSDFMSPYGVLQSPPYHSQRGHHQHNHSISGRAGWNSRGNLRSQSIAIDSNLYRQGQYLGGAQSHMAPFQTFTPGLFDANSIPMTAMPFHNQMDPAYVIQMVAMQLDYYFSVDNLLKDMFLRKHMDSQGFVLMEVVANFNRVRQLTQEKEIIKMACVNSEVIDIRVGDDGKERLRKAIGWEQFLLPIDQREESAQNSGPEQLHRLARQPVHPAQFRSGQMIPPARPDRRSYDSAYPVANGVSGQYSTFGGLPEVMFGDANEEEVRGRTPKSPVHETPVSPMDHNMDAAFEEADFEPDAFPDQQVSVLTVVVKMSPQQRLPYHNLASRTFSNGSIDTRTILTEMDRSNEATPQSKKDGPPVVNGSDMRLPPIPLRRPSPNPTKPRSSERSTSESDLDVFWVKDQEVPVNNLPSDLTSEPYIQLRLKALDQRNHAATGTCPYDMDVLYQFWCHFLIRNFNNRMYSEFVSLANEDARQRRNVTGLQNLMKFYDQSLRSIQYTIRARVVKDYVKLIRNEPPELQGTVFKQLSRAWRDGALPIKNRQKVLRVVDEKFKTQLERLDA